jgi:integrase
MREGDGAHGRRNGQKLSIRDLGRMIQAHYEANGQRSADRMAHAIVHLDRYYGDRSATEAARRFLDYASKRRRSDGAALGTVQRERAALRLGLRLAWERGQIRSIPPIPRIQVKNQRRGFFSPEEFWRVHSELRNPVSDIALFAYITGWRRGEIFGLTWGEVDLEAGVLRLDPGTTKNGEGRLFPFATHRLLSRLVERRHSLRCGLFVFHRKGLPVRSIRKEWKRACGRAGVGNRLLHDLRRTAARDMVRAGVPQPTVMKLMGHKTPAVFIRYAIQDETDLRSGVGRLSELHEGTRPGPV